MALGVRKKRKHTYGSHSYNPLNFLLMTAANELLSEKTLSMSPFFLNSKTETQNQHCSMPHSLVKNATLHLNGVPDSIASPAVNANRNEERLLGVERRLELVKSRGPRNRKPKWLQAEAGHSLVTRQPFPGTVFCFGNGSCPLPSTVSGHPPGEWLSLTLLPEERWRTVKKRTVPLLLR